MNEDHFRKLERMYLAASVNQRHYPSTTVRISEGKAEIGLEVAQDLFHALGALHGSVYFKLLDDAAYFAASSVIEDVFILTTTFNIQFLRPVSSGILKAVGELISTEGGRYQAKAMLYNADGKKVAIGSGEFAKSKAQLSKGIGYY